MVNKFTNIFLFYITIITVSITALPSINYEEIKTYKNKMTATDMPHQPAVPPVLEKDIVHPTQSLLEVAKKSSTSPPQHIQTQILSFV